MSTSEDDASFKSRIKSHYDACSVYYQSLWGEHIHHGYFLTDSDSKELAQQQLIQLLLDRSELPSSSRTNPHLSAPGTESSPDQSQTGHARDNRRFRVLDVGCGIGGTTRYLAQRKGWDVTGLTISDVQVKMAYDISRRSFKSTFSPNGDHPTPSKSDESLSKEMNDGTHPETISLHPGNVRFLELDAEQLYPHFPPNSYDLVWISEVLSHLPEKARFFRNAHAVLRPVRTSSSNLPSSPSLSSSGRLVIADWFKDLSSTPAQYEADILPIEKGMLLPPLASMEDYCEMAKNAGFELVGDVLDISDKVAKTWDISLSLISPSLFALAFYLGTDFVNFLRAFQAMRRGFASGAFRYAVLVFEKREA